MLYKFVRLLVFAYYRTMYRARAEGLENVPETGAVVLCSNHLSNNDPLLLGALIPRVIHFMAKSEIFRVPVLSRLCRALGAIPTDRDAPGMSSFRESLAVLKAGHVLGVFAQGRRYKELDSKDTKSGVALFALKSGAVVIPVKITPGYKLFRRITVRIGEAVDLSAYAGQKTRTDMLREAADVIMAKVSEL